MICLNNVWKTYDLKSESIHALRNINISIPNKSFTAIIGPSGSGKSTLMNLIGCLDIPTKGSMELNGKKLSNYSEDELAKVRGKTIGFVFQKFNLIPTLSALQNVMLPMMFQETPLSKRQEKAKKLLDFVGLGHRLNHRPPQMSGGEQQRVAIARSLVNDPEIILADEPTGNLDSLTGKKIIELFQELNKQGKTIVFVTHDVRMRKYAKKIITINDGEIVGGKK
ncbi:ABC transporter ATP-binding protein [Candidatus Woesearchaeota archaeon]|nr:ABC transporter ATP-binding protein [Candidatus Woesearchaeota archaeon]